MNLPLFEKYMIRLFVLVSSVGLLQSCTTVPKPTLDISEVPVLYEAPVASEQFVRLTESEVEAGLITESVNQPEELLTNNIASSNTDSCKSISDEIERLDAGLGEVAVELPPNTMGPSALERTGEYIYNLATQSVLGVFQPFIQTKRAIFNNDEKDRRLAESVERGVTRRAYLIGYAHASGCTHEVDSPVKLSVDDEA
jgi:hypothetical protein